MNLIRLAIRRPKFITMVTTLFLVLGIFGLRRLPVDLYPSVSYPVLVVRTDFPGASPEEVERIVTKRIEDNLSTTSGLQTLRSTSREASSTVILEFEQGTDVRFQEIQVRGKVSNLRRSFPDSVSEPSIFRQDPDDTPVIELAVSGNRSGAELTRLADDVIALRLRQIPSVGEVDLQGERNPEIAIDLRPDALENMGIEISSVSAAIRAMNRNDPAGQLRGTGRVWSLRSLAQARGEYELGQIAVGTGVDGQPIRLAQIATITRGFEEVRRITRYGNKEGLKQAVLLQVIKQSGANTVEVSDRVRAALAEIQKGLPDDVRVAVTRDNADLVRTNVKDVVESIVLGAIFTVLVVLLFLRSPRSTLTTALSLPSSVLTTFAVMWAAGFTINTMSLLALSLAVGLLVDDAIVVRENIFRHLGKGSPLDAAEKGAKEVQLAVVATTFVIVAVFLPVGFMGGISGQFFTQFAITVVFAVLVSLWDAMTIAPMLSAHYAYIADPALEWARLGRVGIAFDGLLVRFERRFEQLAARYGRLLGKIVARPVVPLGIALLAAAIAVGGFIFVKKGFVPQQLGRTFSASLNGPIAVPMEAVQSVADAAEARLRRVEGLASWTMNSGAGFGGNAGINFTIRVAPEVGRNQGEMAAVRAKVRSAIDGIPGYVVRISEPSDPLAGGGGGRFQPVAVVLTGDELATLQELGRSVRDLLGNIPGVTDVGQIQDEGLPEIRVRTDAQRAALAGVSAEQVGAALFDWVEGDTSNSLSVGDDQIPIRLRVAGARNASPAELLARGIPSGRAGAKHNVPIASVASWDVGSGATVINRENRQRVLRVGASIAPDAALGDIVDILGQRLSEMPLPQGYAARIAGQNEQMAELFGNILQAIAIGSLFVYMVLVSLFESFLHPISVMAAIPLAATGAVLALLGFGLPLDLYGGVGMILLAGIVAKNSILLVDFALQKMRDEGLSATEAMLAAAPVRLRPIVMTSVAMVAGMLPIATGLGVGGAARMSLGVATIGGVVSSTVLTLLVVPSVFVAVCSLIQRFSGYRLRRSGSPLPGPLSE